MSRDFKDITGQKFGSWTVLKKTSERKFTKGRPRVIVWECRCECGTSRKVSGRILLNESKPRSCGCSRKIRAKEQFESHFKKTEDCWLWEGKLNQGGYGKFGAKSTASRLSYQYYRGEISKGLQVCHTCDNRRCVNPDHLFLGTIGDNMRDRTAKNRQAKGSKTNNAILTEEIVLEIRKMRISGLEYQIIADHFGIQWDLARKVCKNNIWKHIPLGKESKEVKQVRRVAIGEASGGAKLTKEKVIQIKEMIKKKIKGKEIARIFSINPSTICDIKQGRTWAHIR